jgi:hypothetical protein
MRAFEKYLFECVGECIVLAKQLSIRLEWNANAKIFLVVHSHSHSRAKQALSISQNISNTEDNTKKISEG